MQRTVENDDLRRQNADLASELSTATSRHEVHEQALANSEARNDQLVAQVADLQQTLAQERSRMESAHQEQMSAIQDLQRRKADAESDRDLFKDLYDKASAHASEVGARKTQLERELGVASSQVTDGLTMVKRMYEGRTQKLQEEVERWKGLCKVLSDKDERTNDEIRRRAAQEPRLREENAALRDEVEELKEEVRRLQNTIQRLADVESEPDPAEIEDALAWQPEDDDMRPQDDSAHVVQENSIEEELPSTVESVHTRDMFVDDSEHSATPLDVQSAIDPEALFYVCQYVTDTSMCNARFPTAEASDWSSQRMSEGLTLSRYQEVKDHAYRAHYSWIISV